MGETGIGTRTWRYLFETRDEKCRRIYSESVRQTQVAIRKLDRETTGLLRSIDKEKVRAKRESKQFGQTALRSCAENIVMLRKQVEKNIWMKCRLQAVLSDTKIARGQVNMVNTIALLNRGMAIMNSGSDFAPMLVTFQQQSQELQFKNAELEGAITFDDDDLFEDEEEAEGIVDAVISEIVGEMSVPAVPTAPLEPIDQLNQLPDVTQLSLNQRMDTLVQ